MQSRVLGWSRSAKRLVVLALDVCLSRFALVRVIFRYTGSAALLATAKATVGYAWLLLVSLWWMQRWIWVPRSLGVLQPLIFFLLVGGSRAFARFWLAGLRLAGGAPVSRFLIFGAGTAGVQTASAMGMSPHFVLVGFVDDDPTKVGHSVNRVPVFSPTRLAELVSEQDITDILLALPPASPRRPKPII